MKLTFDQETNNFFGYVRLNIVYDLLMLREFILSPESQLIKFGFGDMGIPNPTFIKCVYRLFELITEHENVYKREYKKPKKARYGVVFDLLLPKGKVSKEDKIKIIDNFVKSIRHLDPDLPYIAWSTRNRKAKYIHIYFYDRPAFTDIKHYPKIHKRDLYFDKITGKITNKNNPNAIKKYSKGDFVVDQEGNKIYELFSSTKTRIFTFKDHESFNQAMDKFIEYFVNAIKKLQVMIVKEFTIRRNNIRSAYNRWIKRIYVANNSIIKLVQDSINYYYSIYNGEKREQIMSLLKQFRDIFKHGKFEYEHSVYQLKNTRCDKAEKSCEILKSYFFEQLEVIHHG